MVYSVQMLSLVRQSECSSAASACGVFKGFLGFFQGPEGPRKTFNGKAFLLRVEASEICIS
jgi:hypothetical protein